MLRSFVGVLVAAVSFSGLSVVPSVAAAPTVAASAPKPGADVPEGSGLPVVGLSEPSDPAEANDGLENDRSDIPGDATSTVEADATWTDVADMPVEVKVPEGALPETPLETPDETGDSPTDEPTDGEQSSDQALEEPQVEVAWDRPRDLSQGFALLTVVPADSPDPGDPVAEVAGAGVRVDYSGFDELFGGGWADRLRVMAYPACFVETPELAECAAGVQVVAVNNTTADSLRFTTISSGELEASTDERLVDADSGGVVYALTSATGGYAAVPVSPAGEWQVGPGSGEFSYSYPFAVPPSVGGAAPDLELVYSSAAVDGLAEPGAGQASPAGLGWSLEPGYISRSYASCREDGEAGKEDLCWTTDAHGLVEEFTLSLNGRVSRLIPTTVPDEYRLKSDPGWRIIRYQDATPDPGRPDNGDNDNEGFRVFTPDGTQYWFGYGRNGTNSVLTVPVFGNDAEEPGNDPGDAASLNCEPGSGEEHAWCTQGWRWNLDRVVDTSANVTQYSYLKEQNSYRIWGHTGDPGFAETYDRGALLAKVEYGYQGVGEPRQVINVEHTLRCNPQLTNPSAECGGIDGAHNPSYASGWPDVPGELICLAGDATCQKGPSFFTARRYAKVVTTVRRPGGGYDTVDSYQLTHTKPDPDGGGQSTADLWLDQIVRTGFTGGGSGTSLPAVQFTAQVHPNKVVAPGEEQYEKFRVRSIRNETGGRVDVTYGHATFKNCTWAYLNPDNAPALERWEIDRECFGVQSRNSASNEVETDWYHKYVVLKVAVGDDTLGLRLGTTLSSPMNLGKVGHYDYEYQGSPAWRFLGSRNTPFVLESWSDWRGYATTLIKTRPTNDLGQAVTGELAREKILRFRGMSEAPINPAQVDDPGDRDEVYLDTVQFPNTEDQSEKDNNLKEGLTAESTLFNGDGSMISRTYTDYSSILSATTPPDEIDRSARIRFTNWVETHTAIYDATGAPDGTRTRRIDYGYNGADTTEPLLDILNGAPRSVFDEGEPGPEDDTCTLTLYGTNPVTWVRVPTETKTYAGACPNKENEGSVEGVIARSQIVYDNGVLVRGRPTDTYTWLTPAGDPVSGEDVVHTHTVYDTFGRVTETTGPGDPDHELVTRTAYNPNGSNADPLAEVRVTQVDVLDQEQDTHYTPGSDLTTDSVLTTTLDPGRAIPLTVLDPNGGTTRIAYDGLGQTTSVRNPSQGQGDPASVIYTYTRSATAPSRIRTQVLREVNGQTAVYDDSYTFYDGWARAIQTQTPKPETPAERIVAVTGYDERGLTRYTMPAIPNNGGFGAVLNPDLSTVARYTHTTYDGAERPLLVRDKTLSGAVVATTSTAYRGELTTVEPPVGGTTLTRFDLRERPTSVELFDTTNTSGDPEDSVSYTYTLRGELDTAVKTLDTPDEPTEFTWSYGYDMTGRQIWAHDPDTGTTATDYDDAGNPTTVTTGPIDVREDALDLDDPYHPVVEDPTAVITTAYDRLNRPVTKTDETPFNPVTLTTWAYDDPDVDNSIGQLTSTIHPITGVPKPPLPPGPPGSYESRALAYDTQGQPTSTSETYPAWVTDEDPDGEQGYPANTVTQVWATSYNKAGLPVRVDYPALPGLPGLPETEAKVDYTYTTGARLRRMVFDDETSTPTRLAEVVYNNIGQTQSLASGTYTTPTGGSQITGMTRNFTFEQDTGRFNTLNTTITPATSGGTSGTPYPAFGLDYDYDDGGNPLLITGTAAADASPSSLHTGYWCYGYDGLNRLTRAQTGSTNDCATPATAPLDVTGAIYDLSYEHQADRLSAVVDNLHDTGGLDPEQVRVDYQTGDAGVGDEPLRPHHNTQLTTNFLLSLDWADEMPTPGTINTDDHGRIESWVPNPITGLLDPPILADSGPGASSYHYEYNNLGQLENTQAVPTPPLVPDPQTSSVFHSYGPDGTRLIRQSRNLDPGIKNKTTIFLANGTEITKTTVENRYQTLRTFTTPGGTPIATQKYDDNPDGNPLTNDDPTTTWTWLVADAQNTLRLSYDHNPIGASEPSRHHYYPYGDPTTTGPPQTPNAAGYLNQHHDVNGDIRLDHRNYTPNLNTLTTPDPLLDLTDPQSFNPYTYARNNPITDSDPSGLKTLERIEAGGGGAATTAIVPSVVSKSIETAIAGVITFAGSLLGGDSELAPFIQELVKAAIPPPPTCGLDCQPSDEYETEEGLLPSLSNLPQTDPASDGGPPNKPPTKHAPPGFPDDDPNDANAERREFSNLFPNHPVRANGFASISPLVIRGSRISGRFNYVVGTDGRLVIAGRQYGHIDLANGENVLAAGQFRVAHGVVRAINNSSGHYQPFGPSAQAAAEEAFQVAGLVVRPGAYSEILP